MSAEERCERTDLLVSACAHCRPTPERHVFPALYRGRCETCEGDFFQGDKIRETSTGNYEHARHGRR